MAQLAVFAELSSVCGRCYFGPEPYGPEGLELTAATNRALQHFRERTASHTELLAFPRPGTLEWGQMNRKRAELIRKKISGQLNPEERQLYEMLQRLSLEELDRAFPRNGAGEPEENGESRAEGREA
jgi:hypothetical protein